MPADPFAEHVKARINHCMAIAGQAPRYTADGRRMSDVERREWRLEQLRKQESAELLDSPRYRHLFADKIAERLRYIRARAK